MKYINLHTHHFTDNSNITEIVNQFPNEFEFSPTNYSVGIHPWHINEKFYEAELTFIENKISELNCLAVGECGLDKRTEIHFELQVKVFELQLLMAQKYTKPAIIHCVGAFNELIVIRKKLKLTIPLIVHGFSKNETVAKTLVAAGFYISFGKYLMTNPQLENVFYNMPDDRLFLETDSSDYKIEDVYKKAADIKGISVDQLKIIVKNNFELVFDKS